MALTDISPESSFYGSDGEKARLNQEVEAMDIDELAHGPPTLTDIARRRLATNPPAPSPPTPQTAPPSQRRHNIYEGCARAWQLDEPISSFLARLPPSATPATPNDPWIYAANPAAVYQHGDEAGLRRAGEDILDELGATRRRLLGEQGARGGGGGRPVAGYSREYVAARKDAESRIAEAARRCAMTSGKWMLFVLPRDVDEVWAAVARATVAGELGDAAKVAADRGAGPRAERLVCVYTQDFADQDEVRETLLALDRLGLVPKGGPAGGGRPIYYKCDAYTHLGISSGNEWDIPASLYNSRDVLKAVVSGRKG